MAAGHGGLIFPFQAVGVWRASSFSPPHGSSSARPRVVQLGLDTVGGTGLIGAMLHSWSNCSK